MAKKRRRAPRAKAATKHPRPTIPCSKKGCPALCIGEGICRTCEAQVELGKRKPENVFKLAGCRQHAQWAVEKLKRHALIAHPQNIPRAVLAGLLGEL